MSNPSLLTPPSSTITLLGNWPDRSESLAKDLGRYIEFLLAENQKFNLTGDTQPERQWEAHIDDALLAAREVEGFLEGRATLQETSEGNSQRAAAGEVPPRGGRIVDVGSGAGMPGLVWAKLWPGAEICLVESNAKKCAFLERAADVIGAKNVSVLKGRAEDLARLADHREAYDLASARALARLRVLAEWTLPFVRQGGYLIAIKGSEMETEIEEAREALNVLGGQRDPHLLPYVRSDGKECQVVVCEKVGPTPERYPRRAGAARKRPL